MFIVDVALFSFIAISINQLMGLVKELLLEIES